VEGQKTHFVNYLLKWNSAMPTFLTPLIKLQEF